MCVCHSIWVVRPIFVDDKVLITIYPPTFYLISLHTPPSTLLLPHTVLLSYTIHKPPTPFFDVALCLDVCLSWLTFRLLHMHTSYAICAHCTSIFESHIENRYTSLPSPACGSKFLLHYDNFDSFLAVVLLVDVDL